MAKIESTLTIERSILIKEIIRQPIGNSKDTYPALFLSGYGQLCQPLIGAQPQITTIIFLHTANHISGQIKLLMNRLETIILHII